MKPYAGISSLVVLLLLAGPVSRAEDWTQLGFDSRRSGDAPDRSVTPPLGLIGALQLTDAVFTAPLVAEGRAYVVDGSGVAFAIDVESLRIDWKRETRGGRANCNNVSSPAIAGRYLHFGTMSGSHWVLDVADGRVVKEIRSGQPILASPVVANGRVYVATLGSEVYALEPDGKICWKWDYPSERLGFRGDRLSGGDWRGHKGKRVTTADQILCASSPAVYGKTLVLPAGGAVVWLEDAGEEAVVRGVYEPETPTLGLSIGEDGAVYRQWHQLDNGGSVEVLRWVDGKLVVDSVPGTKTSTRGGLLSFSPVSLRGKVAYRSRPEQGFGLVRHGEGPRDFEVLAPDAAISSPVLAGEQAIYGGLDGALHIVPLSGGGESWSFRTAFGKAISASVAVDRGRVYFGCDDGYLYVLGPGGTASLPTEAPELWRIRSPLTSGRDDARFDWFTSFGNWSNSNVTTQPVKPPFRMKWIRRFEGTIKHLSTCGGGRLYTHTAEGQIFAVEQETGRLLWRRYFPGVHISYTSPLYHEGKLLVPQAGLERCQLRCLDAATGNLLWEAPFTGSPSWNRQAPPVVHGKLAIYSFSTGKYAADRWLVGHGAIPGFPSDQKPLVRAYDLETGEEAWTVDFSKYGHGGDDGGICLLDGTLYYSCFFGYSRRKENDPAAATGLTAAIDPATGDVIWTTTKHSAHSGCTISGKDGRLYLGGYSRVDERTNRVWCLDAKDGSLVWQSDPVEGAIHVITIGESFLFTHAQYQNGYLLDKENGKILRTLTQGYKCTRFTCAGPYLLGANMDVRDISGGGDELVSTGPALDPSQCVGAIVSNGRMFYTSHGSGLQASQVFGAEAETARAPWENDE